MKVKLYLTPSDPVDCSLPGSSTHGTFQARVLEWGAIAFSELCSTSYLIIIITNVHIVKFMIFLVVMYRCESWSIKKAECQRTDTFDCGVGKDS